jgi:hypothetical protein
MPYSLPKRQHDSIPVPTINQKTEKDRPQIKSTSGILSIMHKSMYICISLIPNTPRPVMRNSLLPAILQFFHRIVKEKVD